VDVESYARQLKELLPRGAAWAADAGTRLSNLMAGLADELARVDARSVTLIEESDPRTTLELLTDWERVFGLPDECLLVLPTDISERRVLVAQKAVAIGGQSEAFFLELLERLGFTATISLYRPFRVGEARAGDRLYGTAWAFAWNIDVDVSTDIRVFRAGSRVGERLRGWGALDLECIVLRSAPAHTYVIFSYA